MYLSGHLLSSIALAKIIHKPLGVAFFPLAIAAMAVNLIDADHLIYYYRDTGVGNSFLLHPLHEFWAFVGLITCLVALILKPYQNLIFGLFFALLLHYGLDFACNYVTYDLAAIIGFEVCCLALLMLLFRKDEQRSKYYTFFVSLWLVCNATLGFETLVLHWQPHLTRGIYLTSVILNGLFILIFWRLFAGQSKTKKLYVKNG